MKKIVLLLMCFLFLNLGQAYAETGREDYEKLYKFANIPNFELVHDLDPYQTEDYQNYAWAPYPLFRLASDLYFKNQLIPAGYYILTPRMMNGKEYVFFKESGKVKFIIPVVKKELVSPGYYDINVPKVKDTKWQNFRKSSSDKFYTVFKNSSKKQPPPQSYIESTYIDGNMFLVILHYSEYKYTMIFKSTRF